MSDSWLRAEPLWFGVHLVPEHGILPEPKKRSRTSAVDAGSSGETAVPDEAANGSGDDDSSGRKRRRSVSAERRRKALERRKQSSGD